MEENPFRACGLAAGCPRFPRAQAARIRKTTFKNTRKMQKSKIIDGVVVKNADTTLVKHVFLSMPMSKTQPKITLLIDKLLKTRCKMTNSTNDLRKHMQNTKFKNYKRT